MANDGRNDVETLNGFFKDIYADKLGEIIPDGVKFSKMVGFVPPAKRLGSTYKQPISLTLEHGVTYGGSAGDAFGLKNPVNGATKEANVQGFEMVLRGQVSIGAISRSTANASASFGRATKHVIKNLFTSSYKKHETQLFYGQTHLATVTIPDGFNSNVLTVDDTEWAPGIWSGGEGMRLSLYNATTDAWVAAADPNSDEFRSITAVDIENKGLTISGANITNASGSDQVLEIYEYGSVLGLTRDEWKVMLGLDKMLKTTTGDIFGVSSTTYSLWRANQYVVPLDGGSKVPLSYKHISKGISKAVAKGVEGKITLIVNPEIWADLLDAQTSKRSFDSSYGTAEYKEGSEKIMFYSQNGLVEIIASTYCKLGYAYAINLPCFSRVGSSDVTFKLPGTKEDFVIKPESSHAIEFRTYCDIALFCDAIGQNIVFSNFAV